MNQSIQASMGSQPAHTHAFARPMRPLRFLLADGCRQSRMGVTAVLARWGILPTVACNGAQAVRIVEQHDFDFVLMEILMPEMDGAVATARIRQFEREHPARAPVPIVAHTALDLASVRVCLARIGLSAVLPKPCGADALRACLQQWCRDPVAPARTAAH